MIGKVDVMTSEIDLAGFGAGASAGSVRDVNFNGNSDIGSCWFRQFCREARATGAVIIQTRPTRTHDDCGGEQALATRGVAVAQKMEDVLEL